VKALAGFMAVVNPKKILAQYKALSAAIINKNKARVR
jgi:hypothetical protein